jgi:glucosyl-dolichyl phosphate glucuronosyltransferase
MVAAGGPVRPAWEVSPPRWVENFLRNQKIFPILSLMEQSGEFSFSGRGFFFGVNMAIRRSILFELGGFNPEAFGDVWLGDGETGLNHKLWKREMLVGYIPDAVVHHHIPAERMTIEYFKRRMGNEGACDMYTRFHQKMPGPSGLLYQAASILIRNSVFWMMEPLVAGRTDWLCLRIQLQAARSRAQLEYVSRLIRDKEFRQFVRRQDWLNSPCT